MASAQGWHANSWSILYFCLWWVLKCNNVKWLCIWIHEYIYFLKKEGLKIPNGLGCDFSTVDRGQWKYPQLCLGGGGAWSATHTLCKALLLDLHMIKRKKSNESKSLDLFSPVQLCWFYTVSPVLLGPHHCRFLVSAWRMGQKLCEPGDRENCASYSQWGSPSPLNLPQAFLCPQEAVWFAESHLLWEATQAPVLLCQESAAWPWASHLTSFTLISHLWNQRFGLGDRAECFQL